MGRLLLLVYLVCSLVTPTVTVTSSEVDDITTALEDMFDALENRSDDEKHFILAHQAVRLSFHDCVGGCDGCLNSNNAANANLDNTVTKLEELWIEDDVVDGSKKISEVTGFSRADFWALAGVVALNFLSKCPKISGTCPDIEVVVTFRYGRTDCATAPTTSTVHTFPEGHGDWQHIRSFFNTEFGFTPKKTVAIMGAHTIGRGHALKSGFKNRWVDKWDKVDNQYYIDLLDANQAWEQQDHPANPSGNGQETFYQWNENGDDTQNMMLNADMSVIKLIDVDSATGEAGCIYANCLDSAGKTHAETFKNSNQDWIDYFVDVFQEMIENGYTSAQMTVPS